MNSCKRCGTCCKNGGPALHKQDKHLFNSLLTIEDCITIRKGEPAFSPLSQAVEPTKSELIKIAGKADSWQCCYYNEAENQCGIYEQRPVECSLLQCWDTSALTAMIYEDTLKRTDLIEDKSLLEMINKHETLCSFSKLQELVSAKNNSEINAMMRLDLSIRQDVVTRYDLSLAKELFCFGRPMFKSAPFYGIDRGRL